MTMPLGMLKSSTRKLLVSEGGEGQVEVHVAVPFSRCCVLFPVVTTCCCLYIYISIDLDPDDLKVSGLA